MEKINVPSFKERMGNLDCIDEELFCKGLKIEHWQNYPEIVCYEMVR